ncbi:MAG: hypothetical protein RR385_09605 [Clostridiales bacterium]
MMKKMMILLLVVICFQVPVGVLAEEITVKADAALIMDMDTQEVLWEKEGETPMAPASLIKLLNILTAYPYIDFSEDIMVGPLAESLYAGQLLNLHQGDILEVGELIYGMMLYSANDAAIAMADYIVGDDVFYAALMDKKAWALGAIHTKSINVNGYSDVAQKTTAHDLGIIATAFMDNPTLAQIAGTKSHTFTWLSPQKGIPLTNINRFLYSYQGATGLKTGTTDMAGKCLIATAKRNEKSLLTVALNSSQRYEDCILMMDYGFSLVQ